MSSKREDVLNEMLQAYVDNTSNGFTDAVGVNVIVSAMMEASPEDRVSIMEEFEKLALEVNCG